MIQNGCNLSYLGICVYAKGRVPSSNKRTNKQVAEPPIYKLPKVRDAFQRKTKRNVWNVGAMECPSEGSRGPSRSSKIFERDQTVSVSAVIYRHAIHNRAQTYS